MLIYSWLLLAVLIIVLLLVALFSSFVVWGFATIRFPILVNRLHRLDRVGRRNVFDTGYVVGHLDVPLAPAFRRRPEAHDRLAVDLANTRFRNVEHLANLLEIKLLLVVQRQDKALAFRQLIDRLGKLRPEL